jgi:hypothetical protein
MTNNINYDCYICLENTKTYYKSNSCNCKIYCHEKCIDNIITYNKCIICKKTTNIHYINNINYYHLFINIIMLLNNKYYIFISKFIKNILLETPLYTFFLTFIYILFLIPIFLFVVGTYLINKFFYKNIYKKYDIYK